MPSRRQRVAVLSFRIVARHRRHGRYQVAYVSHISLSAGCRIVNNSLEGSCRKQLDRTEGWGQHRGL